MAPSTAILMLLLSLAAFQRARPSANCALRLLEPVAAWLVLGGGAFFELQHALGVSSPVELWLSQTSETVGKIPVGRISPLTAGCFMLAGAAQLSGQVDSTRWLAARSLGGFLGVVNLAVSAIVVAGYLGGMPFLYGGETIPMALLTGLAFALVSVATLLGGDREAWPLRMFLGNSAVSGVPGAHRFERSLLLLFLVLAVGILLAGVRFLNHRQIQAREAAHQELSAIADLKVQQIVNWRQERLADAAFIRATPYAARRALDALAQPGSSSTRRMFTSWLEPLLKGGSYEHVMLLDEQLKVGLVHPEGASPVLSEEVRRPAEETLRTRQVGVTELHRAPGDSRVHWDLLIPLVVRREGTNDAVPAVGSDASPADRGAGVLLLRVNAHDFLYPLIQSWPTRSPTAETLIVRRDGQEVLFLNPLRHQTNAALSLRRPLAEAQLPAAMGVRGESGVQEGVDYRGMPVVAAVARVSATDWVMVAKVDESELYAPLRRQALGVAALAATLLFVAALGITVLWRRRNEEFLQTQLATERERRALAEHAEQAMKRAGDSLRESEALFHSLVEHMPQHVFRKDVAGRFTFGNGPFCAGLGCSPASILGKTDFDFCPAELATKYRQDDLHVIETGQMFEGEEVFQAADGRAVFVHVLKTPLHDAAGQVVGVQGISWDITERKRAEVGLRLFRTLIDRANDIILVVDPETGAVLDANEKSWVDLGYTREEFLTLKIPDLDPGADSAAMAKVKDEVQRAGFVVLNGLHRRKDGSTFPVEVSLKYVQLDRGYIISVARDVSERRRLDQERAAMEAQLRQQQKLESIGTLAGGVAHEINNPINGIMNYTQLIQDRLEPGSPLVEYTGEILHESQRVATIVRDLLTFARNEKQSHSPARIVDIVESTLSLIRTVIRHDHITLTIQVPSDLPRVKCRSQQLQQVVMNLITNARDALNERYPGHDSNKILRMEAGLIEKGGGRWIRLTVEDFGIGIRPEVRQRMFDPFFTTKPRDQGTGLGLSISHSIAKDHGGDLAVESEPGRFTRMHLDLPVDPGGPE